MGTGDEPWQRAIREATNWLRRYPDAWTREHRDDMAQEAVVHAWQWSARARDLERLSAAVRTIATRVRGRWMRVVRFVQPAPDAAHLIPAVEQPPPTGHYQIAGRRVPAPHALPWVSAALERLPRIDRELLLGFYEGFCCTELAERYGRSLPCVKTRIHRARRRVQTDVEECARAADGFDDGVLSAIQGEHR